MKKSIAMLLLMAGFLTGCGNDDYVPELNKLSKIVCTKNGQSIFLADLTYDQAGHVTRIQLERDNKIYTDNYIWSSTSVTVTGIKTEGNVTTLPFAHTIYSLDGDRIVKKDEKQENPFQNNAVYTAVSDEYIYRRKMLMSVNQVVQWPKEDGSGYERRSYNGVEQYTWENSTLTLCAYQKEELTFQYDTERAPSNFPLRIISTLNPVDFDIVSPVNFYYGVANKYLPVTARLYNVSNASVPSADYSFRYVWTSEYVTGMVILETVYDTEGNIAESNEYDYTFGYNYVNS